MDDIYIYSAFFSNLSVSRKNGDIAPHKPILLISVMDLILLKQITSPVIKKNPLLITYFENNWDRYVGDIKTYKCELYYTFKALDSEAFWHLTDSSTAEIDEELFYLSSETNQYTILKQVLINTFLPQSIAKLKNEILENKHLPRLLVADSKRNVRFRMPKDKLDDFLNKNVLETKQIKGLELIDKKLYSNGLSAQGLAKKTNMTLNVVEKVLRGDNTIRLGTLVSILDILGLELDVEKMENND